MKEHLFQEFPDVTAEQWKQQIQADLKGADYDENLIFNSLDGVRVKPFYTSEDIKGSIQLPPPKRWSICEKIFAETAEAANREAKFALEKGAETLTFILSSEEIAPEILFEGIDLEKVKIYLNLRFLPEDYLKKLHNYLGEKKHQVYPQVDVLGNLAATGNWFFSSEKDFRVLKSVFSEARTVQPVISVDTTLYQNAGATIPQQLAYALAHMNEYLNLLSQKGQIQQEFLPHFSVAVGGNYFFEIAKVRALRWLYASLAKEYDLSKRCVIQAEPTRRDKTLYDYNVNLLRTTTQCMSAVLGGVDVVNNLPFDSLFHRKTEFGQRIARNQLLVMKHEAYLNKVANPADGAYYIERLTRDFAASGLQLFQEIERAGGFLELLLQGKIQQQIAESAEKEQELFDRGELVLIGTNKFANPQDRMKENIDLDPFSRKPAGKTAISPIIERRLSEKQEQERLQKEEAHLTQSQLL